MPVLMPEPLSLVLLIVSALLVEKRYIGRLAITSNVFFLWQLFTPHWYELPEIFQLYLNIGLLFAIIALVSYVVKQSLPSGFYKFAKWLFGSLTVVAIIVYTFIFIF